MSIRQVGILNIFSVPGAFLGARQSSVAGRIESRPLALQATIVSE